MRFLVSFLSDRVIVPSNAAKKDLKLKSHPGKTEVIHNGVDLERYRPWNSRNILRAELDIHSDTKIVAIIGSVKEGKGHLDFVEAAKNVHDRVKNVFFLVVGDGEEPYFQAVQRRVEELSMGDNFRFTGFREDIEDILSSVDLIVSASWVECFSKVLCEAMAAGKPVVATRCGGPEEIVVDGETGFLVNIRSPEKLAEAMLCILSSSRIIKEMGEKGRQRAEKLFSSQQYVNKIEKVIEELC